MDQELTLATAGEHNPFVRRDKKYLEFLNWDYEKND